MGHRTRLIFNRRSIENCEGFEVFYLVTGVHVDVILGGPDRLVKKCSRESLSKASVGITRKATIQVEPVVRHDERTSRFERRNVGHRYDAKATAQFCFIESIEESS